VLAYVRQPRVVSNVLIPARLSYVFLGGTRHFGKCKPNEIDAPIYGFLGFAEVDRVRVYRRGSRLDHVCEIDL
jgi:hypothetical protein